MRSSPTNDTAVGVSGFGSPLTVIVALTVAPVAVCVAYSVVVPSLTPSTLPSLICAISRFSTV